MTKIYESFENLGNILKESNYNKSMSAIWNEAIKAASDYIREGIQDQKWKIYFADENREEVIAVGSKVFNLRGDLEVNNDKSCLEIYDEDLIEYLKYQNIGFEVTLNKRLNVTISVYEDIIKRNDDKYPVLGDDVMSEVVGVVLGIFQDKYGMDAFKCHSAPWMYRKEDTENDNEIIAEGKTIKKHRRDYHIAKGAASAAAEDHIHVYGPSGEVGAFADIIMLKRTDENTSGFIDFLIEDRIVSYNQFFKTYQMDIGHIFPDFDYKFGKCVYAEWAAMDAFIEKLEEFNIKLMPYRAADKFTKQNSLKNKPNVNEDRDSNWLSRKEEFDNIMRAAQRKAEEKIEFTLQNRRYDFTKTDMDYPQGGDMIFLRIDQEENKDFYEYMKNRNEIYKPMLYMGHFLDRKSKYHDSEYLDDIELQDAVIQAMGMFLCDKGIDTVDDCHNLYKQEYMRKHS